MNTAKQTVGLTLFTLGMFIFFGLLDGASTGRFVWEAAVFGATAGLLICGGFWLLLEAKGLN